MGWGSEVSESGWKLAIGQRENVDTQKSANATNQDLFCSLIPQRASCLTFTSIALCNAVCLEIFECWGKASLWEVREYR